MIPKPTNINGKESRIFPPKANNKASNIDKVAMKDLTILESFLVLMLANIFRIR